MPSLLSLNNYHYRRGGSDAVFLEHAEIFSALGWNTAMFSMEHPKNTYSPWQKYFVRELEFGEQYSFIGKLSMAGKVVYSREAKKKLSKLLDDYPVDIAHSHCIYHHLSPSVLVELKSRGIPSVMTAHDLKLACPAYKMLNELGVCEECKNRNLLPLIKHKCIHGNLAVSSLVAIESTIHKALGLYRNNLDKIVAPSKFYRDKLIEWGWEKEVIEYIPNYIDVDKFTTQVIPGNYALYFGRLAPEKGIGTLIQSAIRTGLELKIAGTGPSEKSLRQLAGDHSNIQFLGYVGGEALWDLVQRSRVVVIPSEWYENAPISLLESYACGKPVIGARIGGIPEMIIEGETGMLFTSTDEGSLIDSLERCFTMSDTEVSKLGSAAREFVGKQFTKEEYVRRMLSLYRGIGVKF